MDKHRSGVLPGLLLPFPAYTLTLYTQAGHLLHDSTQHTKQ